jgi:Holliday junction resolvase RusA-like endonuclease
MPKPRKKLHVRIPPYRSPRNDWRQDLHAAIVAAQSRERVVYAPSDRLEVRVQLYLAGRATVVHDVDNRLKDVLDALQGRAGGSKAVRSLAAIVPNDRQIYRVIIEKSAPPWQSRGL